MDLTWSISVAILATLTLLGKLADAALHRSHIPTLKDWLFRKAISFDELSYTQLFHEDTKKKDQSKVPKTRPTAISEVDRQRIISVIKHLESHKFAQTGASAIK